MGFRFTFVPVHVLLVLFASHEAVAQPARVPRALAAPIALQPHANPTPLTWSGCMADAIPPMRQLTASETNRGLLYRLTRRIRVPQFGKRVQVVGGLVPTTNVAAQLGDVDSTVVSIAFMTSNVRESLALVRPKVRISWAPPTTGPCGS